MMIRCWKLLPNPKTEYSGEKKQQTKQTIERNSWLKTSTEVYPGQTSESTFKMVKSSACSKCWSCSVCSAELCCVLLAKAWLLEALPRLRPRAPVRPTGLCVTVGIHHEIRHKGELGPGPIWGMREVGGDGRQEKQTVKLRVSCTGNRDVCWKGWALKW